MIYGYIRVSTDRQTVENQRFEINHFCERNVMIVDKWIEETISGTKTVQERKLGKLLKKMKKDDILICSELSRLGRNLLMIMGILNECMNRNVQVWTIKDNYRLGQRHQFQSTCFCFWIVCRNRTKSHFSTYQRSVSTQTRRRGDIGSSQRKQVESQKTDR